MPAADAPTSPGAAKTPRRSRLGAAGRWAGFTTRWGGLAICALVIAAWIYSTKHDWEHPITIPGTSGCCSGTAYLMGGVLEIEASSYDSYINTPGFSLHSRYRGWRDNLWIRPRFDWFWNQGFLVSLNVLLPLWLVLTIAILPTAAAWLAVLRRAKAGHCPCGYDLAGLPASASVCPECGKTREQKAVSA